MFKDITKLKASTASSYADYNNDRIIFYPTSGSAGSADFTAAAAATCPDHAYIRACQSPRHHGTYPDQFGLSLLKPAANERTPCLKEHHATVELTVPQPIWFTVPVLSTEPCLHVTARERA